MTILDYSEARRKLVQIMNQICRDHAPVTLTRKGEDAVVMMSLEDFEALQETCYLVRSPKNARRLLSSIAQLESGIGRARRVCCRADEEVEPRIRCISARQRT